jgi:predicted amidohydrolase YtcJ
VITLSSDSPRAQAIAVQDQRILAVGSNADVLKLRRTGTRVVDCEGRTIVPGLVDCHVHMKEFGFSLHEIDLRRAESVREIQDSLRRYAKDNPETDWILGGRWDEQRFSEKRCLTRWDLDLVVDDKPVFLNRVCGHLSVANSKALQVAGISKHTCVQGGIVDLDEGNGEPSGILKGNAVNLVSRFIPSPTIEAFEMACSLACQKAVEAGLTEVHWLVDSGREISVLQKMFCEGRLPLRVYLCLPGELLEGAIRLGVVSGFGNDMLKIGYVKFFADGSLGTRTAALKQSYSDDPKTRGIMLHTRKQLRESILRAHSNGFQVGVHAIGDRAIETVVDVFEEVLKTVPRKNHRHRIEHCSVLNPGLISRMRGLGLIASVQPQFVVSDSWAVQRLGPRRARWIYPFRTLLEKGVVVASGSDCPIELINPMLGLWSAVMRKDKPDESLTLEETLRTYTVNAAHASFDEDKKGTIEKGKYADLTVLSKNLDETPKERICDVKADMVVVNGRITYSRRRG